MKIAGIVVYNPDYERLLKNINAIYPQVDELVIYQNSEIDRRQLLRFDKIQYLNNGKNQGIAKALNAIMEYADSLSVEWCLLLDQDSVAPVNYLEKIEQYKRLDSAAVLCPLIHDDRDRKRDNVKAGNYEEIDMCITSGSYNNIEAWKKVRGFREEFFIDYVDWEYCARVRSKGYKIYQINEMAINHELGKKTYHKFFGKDVFTYNHSAFRKYFITRNTIVSYRLFKDEPQLAHPYLKTWKRLLFTVLYEEEKKKKIKAIFQGIIDSSNLYKKLKGKKDYGY